MGNILLISENDEIFNKYKKLLDSNNYNFNSCCTPTSIFDLIEISPIDVVLIDEFTENLNLLLTIKRIKSKQDNTQILLISNGENLDEEISKLISGYILKNYSDKLPTSIIETLILNLSDSKQAVAINKYKNKLKQNQN